jgi:hypothetical protein
MGHNLKRAPWLLKSKLPLDKIRHHAVQVPGGIAQVDAMVAIGIVHRLKLLVGLDERIDKIDCILKMDIVVARAMHQEQVPFQLVDMGDGAVIVVTSGVDLGSLQVALGVDRIEIPASRHRRHGDGGFEDIFPPTGRSMTKALGEFAITPFYEMNL